MAAVYVVWIGLVPASLAIALVWTRRSHRRRVVRHGDLASTGASAWSSTTPCRPSGPSTPRPSGSPACPARPTPRCSEMLLDDRIEVLAAPWDTGAVQTIAAFASLHVAVMVTICLMAEQMRLPAAGPGRRLGVPRADLRGDGLPGVALLRRRARRVRRRRRWPSCWRPGPPATRCGAATNRGRSAPRPDASHEDERGPPADAAEPPSPVESASRSRSAYAAASPSAYFVRGQKKPRSPSPLVRGTTWRWRCGTDWLTVLLIATNEPCAPRRVLDRRREPLGRREEPVALPRREVREGLEVGARHEQDVSLEDRPGVEERDQVVGLQHEVTGQVAGDDLAEHASVHVTDGATGHRPSDPGGASPDSRGLRLGQPPGSADVEGLRGGTRPLRLAHPARFAFVVDHLGTRRIDPAHGREILEAPAGVDLSFT